MKASLQDFCSFPFPVIIIFNLIIFRLLEGEQETARSTSAQAPETEDLKWFYQGRNGWWE